MAKPSSGHLRALAYRAEKLEESIGNLAKDLREAADRSKEWEEERERRVAELRARDGEVPS